MTKTKYIKVKEENKPIFKIGNRKIGYDTIIFSLSSGHKCINKNRCPYGIDGSCYALKDERVFQANKLRNNEELFGDRQGKYFKDHTTRQLFFDFLSIISTNTQIRYIRFNESGDIDNKQTYLKINNIAKLLKPYGIIVYTYTHSNKLFKQLKQDGTLKQKSDNFIINGSDNFMIDNTFKVINKKDQKDNMIMCKMNCRECNLCKEPNKNIIHVIKH
jgi:hypothetical protein